MRTTALHRNIHGAFIARLQRHVVDAEPCGDERRRNHEGVPLAAGNPHADPSCDEVVAETIHHGVSGDPAILNLRIDERDRSEPRAGLSNLGAVDAHAVADFEELCVALGNAKAQHEILLGDRGNDLAGKNDGADRVGHAQDAAGRRSQNLAFRHLPLDDRALGNACPQRILGNIDGGARLVEPRLRRRATLEQALRTGKVGLGLSELRLEPGDLGVERLHLKGELFVADSGNDLPCRDFVAFFDCETGDRSPGADSGRHRLRCLDRREHRFVVGDAVGCHDMRFGSSHG